MGSEELPPQWGVALETSHVGVKMLITAAVARLFCRTCRAYFSGVHVPHSTWSAFARTQMFWATATGDTLPACVRSQAISSVLYGRRRRRAAVLLREDDRAADEPQPHPSRRSRRPTCPTAARRRQGHWRDDLNWMDEYDDLVRLGDTPHQVPLSRLSRIDLCEGGWLRPTPDPDHPAG